MTVYLSIYSLQSVVAKILLHSSQNICSDDEVSGYYTEHLVIQRWLNYGSRFREAQ